MRVALLASAFHPSLGGVEELVRQLGRGLQAAGDEVVVITNRWPRHLPERDEHDGLPVYRLPFRLPVGGPKAIATYLASTAVIHARLARLLRSQRCELLHVQCVSGNGWYALHAHRRLGLPLLVSSQGERTMDAEGIYQKSAFMNRIMRACLRHANYVTACSATTLQDLQEHYRQPLSDRSTVVYNGVRLQDFVEAVPYSHGRPYVLGLGRLVPQKGFDVLIEAFRQANLPDHDLLLAGDGPEAARLQASQSDRIHLVGRTDRKETISLFAGADVFVLPSRREPQGIVNLEAMAAGKAVIATRVGGVPEIVQHDVTGLLVPPDDPVAMAAALRRLATDDELRARLGAAGHARAQAFDWPAITEQYRTLYRQLLSHA